MKWTMLFALLAMISLIAAANVVGQTGGTGEPQKTPASGTTPTGTTPTGTPPTGTPPTGTAPTGTPPTGTPPTGTAPTGTAPTGTPPTGAAPAPAKPGEIKAPEPKSAVGANPMVMIETNMGNIKVELYKDKAPISVDNFLSYVKEGYYDSTIVHRVSSYQNGQKFVIQAGGIDIDMHQKPQKPGIKNEATNGLSNLRGTLSMARTSEINSGSSHFFINLSDNKGLDHKGNEPATYGYAVFGKVVEGMDVVDKIAQVKVGTKGGYSDVPIQPVVITKMKLVAAGPKLAGPKQPEPKKVGEPETQPKPGETSPKTK